MMTMIRELAKCNQASFDGWRIGTVRVDIAGPASRFFFNHADAPFLLQYYDTRNQ